MDFSLSSLPYFGYFTELLFLYGEKREFRLKDIGLGFLKVPGFKEAFPTSPPFLFLLPVTASTLIDL